MKTTEYLAPPSELPSAVEQERFMAIGLTLDNLGRPLHPWRDHLPDLSDGKGFFWQWGPNYTVDPIVIKSTDHPSLLLIRRGDNGKLALPGGFIEQEDAATAGQREVLEETGVHIEGEPTECYQGPVHDDRSTRHAWPETTALLWRTETSEQACAGDDAAEASWVPLSKLRGLSELHGSHATLIDTAIREHGTPLEQLEYFDDASDITTPGGGHMGYDRLIATLPTEKRLFIKRHDPEKFTDSVREGHSRRYLRKEQQVYRALASQSPHVPDSVQLIDDHTLIMDAYDPRDGWHWRAPEQPAMKAAYLQDTLAALTSLSSVSVPEFPEIEPAYDSIVQEGWGAYPNLSPTIQQRLVRFNCIEARELAADLDMLYQQFINIPRPNLDTFAHFDIRQSNITWHPKHGVRIVDWSWADRAPRGVDTTSLLIDLAKAGHDVTAYHEYFNTHYALTLVGFWLAHSTWPTPTPDQTVREHQISSAIAAHQLIKRFGEQR